MYQSALINGKWSFNLDHHYDDVITSRMTSQITGAWIVCPTVCSGTDQSKHQSSASLAFVRGIHVAVTGGFPSQRASNAEDGSIWWRHHIINLMKDDTPSPQHTHLPALLRQSLIFRSWRRTSTYIRSVDLGTRLIRTMKHQILPITLNAKLPHSTGSIRVISSTTDQFIAIDTGSTDRLSVSDQNDNSKGWNTRKKYRCRVSIAAHGRITFICTNPGCHWLYIADVAFIIAVTNDSWTCAVALSECEKCLIHLLKRQQQAWKPKATPETWNVNRFHRT